MRIKKILTVISFLLVASLLMGAGCWIVPINKAPEITSDPVETAKVGVSYTYDVEATDPDTEDVLTYSLTVEPTGMLIDGASGLITWTPKAEGSFDVTVEVSDGEFSDTQDFTIVVSAAPSNDATLKSLTVTVGTLVPEFASDTYTYDVELPYGANKVPSIVATPTDPNAKVKIGMLPGFDPPVVVPIWVTAEDGVTKKTYKVTFTVAAPVSMEINVDLPISKVGIPARFTVDIVANDDDGTMVNGYFTLPVGDYEISCEEWADVILSSGTRYKIGSDEGYLLTDTTLHFIATFNSVETYLMTLEVETTDGILLCKKDIEVVVEAAPVAATLESIAITNPASKLYYNIGEELDITGLVVTGTYSDGTTKVETITTDNVTGFDSSEVVRIQVLTITVGDQTTTYTVTITTQPLSQY